MLSFCVLVRIMELGCCMVINLTRDVICLEYLLGEDQTPEVEGKCTLYFGWKEFLFCSLGLPLDSYSKINVGPDCLDDRAELTITLEHGYYLLLECGRTAVNYSFI